MADPVSSVVAVIPARGGSKGIPGKNLRPLAGRPMVAHSIAHALLSGVVSRVVVSTDSDEIAAVSRTAGAEVVARPAAIAGDEASSESALQHTLDEIGRGAGDPELVVFLQATSPLRRPRHVAEAVAALRDADADSLFSASPLHGFVWRTEADTATPTDYDPCRRPRRQDLPEQVVENGSIYVFRPWVLRRRGSRLGGRIVVYRMGFLEGLQVDAPSDLSLVEALLPFYLAQEGS